MKGKKQVEKKEIVPVYNIEEQKPWWEFKLYSEEERQKIDEFFTNFSLELQDLIAPDIYDTVRNISNKIGIEVHPQFGVEIIYPSDKKQQEPRRLSQSQQQNMQFSENKDQHQQSQQQQSSQQQQGDDTPMPINENLTNYIILQNNKYDYATLKSVLFHFQNVQEMNVFKFANNSFDPDNIKFLFEYFCNQETTKIKKLFYDWNPLPLDLGLEIYPKLGLSNIEFLVLRSNNITSEIIVQLCDQIKQNPNCQIKHLELYDNRIDEQGFQAIGDLLSDYFKLEYLSLSQNNITSFESIKPITQNIGYVVLDEEGLQQYQDQEKERDELLALKAKKKKIDEARLEFLQNLLPLKQISEGVFAFVKNPQLKILNLAMNPIPEQDKEECAQFIKNLPDEFSLILLHNNFEQKTKEKMRKQFKKTLVI